MTEPTFAQEELNTAGIIGLIAIWVICTGIGIVLGGFGGALIGIGVPWAALSIATFVLHARQRMKAKAKAREESKP